MNQLISRKRLNNSVEVGFREGIILVSELERFDNKLDRLLCRNEKVMFEIMDSKLTDEDKADLYETYWSFVIGFWGHLEDKYPYLKEAGKNKKG